MNRRNALSSLLLSIGAQQAPASPKGRIDETIATSVQAETVYVFRSAKTGFAPQHGVVRGPDGSLYGMTPEGGKHEQGTLFRILPDGTETVLKSFSGPDDGLRPVGRLAFGPDGRLYGVLSMGGGGVGHGGGAIFRIDAHGANYTTLHGFRYYEDRPEEPYRPDAGLVLAADGNFYGTTSRGGPSFTGTIFRMKPDGWLKFIHAFGRGIDGEWPSTQLAEASDGKLYGATTRGGANGVGVIYRISLQGTFKTVRAIVSAEGDALLPLVETEPGVFHGAAAGGGRFGGGTAFRMTRRGEWKVLHDFGEGPTDAATPSSALLLAADGHFYGCTRGGGRHGAGTVYRLQRHGRVQVVLPFGGRYENGFFPSAERLEAGPDGWMVASCSGGGVQIGAPADGSGTVFRFRPEADAGSAFTRTRYPRADPFAHPELR